ncbi:DNA-directed RNA polymerase, mitochondrial [Cylas formicarius]|uniref:DNA-directed RNA polymerase, mitochondrial n=1 Tax=Cylas formicarius TaxID=197179 RepID=UPI0029588996|nr:DNA-directed RNA polymerase, mitochondrial [Cylas formicarius]
MYKVLEVGKISLQRYSLVSLRNLAENDQLSASEKTCILCKHLHLHSRIQFRKVSSIANNSNLTKTQKILTKKKKATKYTDILMVVNNRSVLKKANIKKLSSKEVKLLSSSPINLNELYKLEYLTSRRFFQVEHCYNDLTIIDDFPNPGSSDVSKLQQNNFNTDFNKYEIDLGDPAQVREIYANEEAVIEDCDLKLQEKEVDLESVKLVNAFQPEEIEEESHDHVDSGETSRGINKLNKTIVEHNVLDQKFREEITSKTLAAYMEVCNYLHKPGRGLAAFYSHRVKSKKCKSIISLKHVNVYSTLLKGFANRADYIKLKEVLKIMEEDGLKPNLQCYIAIFECLGRLNMQNNHLKDIRIFTKEAHYAGYSFDQMMNNGVFLNDEREIVLAAMRAYNPKYVPTYEDPKIFYNNHLVNHLNHDERLSYQRHEWIENGGLFTPTSLEEAVQKQFKLEENGYVTVKSIASKDKPTDEILRYRKILNEHLTMWEEAAHAAFNRRVAALAAERGPLNLEIYFRSVPTHDMVAIMLDEAKKLATGSETYSPTLGMLYRSLGRKVYARYRVLFKQKTGVLDKVLTLHKEYSHEYAIAHGKYDHMPTGETYVNPRVQWQWLEHNCRDKGSTISSNHQPWVPPVVLDIGKFLYQILLHDFKINVDWKHNGKHKCWLPAFYTIFRNQSRTVTEEIKPHPELAKLFRAAQPETLTFPANEVPMLCPPVPWTSVDHGGYLLTPCDIVRLPAEAQAQKQRLEESDPVQLYPSFDALNQLASTPWTVNRKVLDIILEVFRSGGSSRLDVPVDPATLAPPPAATSNMSKAEKFKAFQQKLQHRRMKNEMFSLWCDCLYRLSLANHFRDHIFWLPHNMDFRGRVYPVPPHLNHLGSDLARSILIFAEPRPLGPKGLDWLKIHLINLTGLKKRDSVDDRLKYANDNMHLILDSADRPLDGEQWWVHSDEPWQTLACCMEIADAVRSGVDPEEYLSRFPVHQDGSCNGLQHYAALGRDSAGAYSVNLAPSKGPQDVYSAVVALVERRRIEDAENGVAIAKLLEGFVTRKVIKQTIMTTVYGVTQFGARLQIARQLKDLDDFPKDSVWAASLYLTKSTFDSLKTMFTSTKEIQDWFTECAKLISGVTSQHIEWVTPLGLPVVQPYNKHRKVSPGYKGYSIDKYTKPNTMKQKNAFPPNFIHSLDSCHMMLTSLHAERAGITFVSVHDCYWTHPSTIHIMNRICREQFVALHSEPILESLSQFLHNKYSYDESEIAEDDSGIGSTKKHLLNSTLRQLPKTGDFDIRKVLKSIYFFS